MIITMATNIISDGIRALNRQKHIIHTCIICPMPVLINCTNCKYQYIGVFKDHYIQVLAYIYVQLLPICSATEHCASGTHCTLQICMYQLRTLSIYQYSKIQQDESRLDLCKVLITSSNLPKKLSTSIRQHNRCHNDDESNFNGSDDTIANSI